MNYGLLKLVDNTFATFTLIPSSSDSSIITPKIYAKRKISNFKAYYFNHTNSTLIWSNGTSIIASYLNLVVSRSGTVTTVELIDITSA